MVILAFLSAIIECSISVNPLTFIKGFGGYGGIGVELFFEEGGNLMLTARVSRDKVRMGNYEDDLWQGALYLTWVIPPQLGDFIRASF